MGPESKIVIQVFLFIEKRKMVQVWEIKIGDTLWLVFDLGIYIKRTPILTFISRITATDLRLPHFKFSSLSLPEQASKLRELLLQTEEFVPAVLQEGKSYIDFLLDLIPPLSSVRERDLLRQLLKYCLHTDE